MRIATYLIAAVILGVVSSGRAEVVDFNDLAPADNTVVNDFWDCRNHVCQVEQVVSSEVSGTDVSSVESVVEETSDPCDIECREFVRECSGLLDIWIRLGLILIFK